VSYSHRVEQAFRPAVWMAQDNAALAAEVLMTIPHRGWTSDSTYFIVPSGRLTHSHPSSRAYVTLHASPAFQRRVGIRKSTECRRNDRNLAEKTSGPRIPTQAKPGLGRGTPFVCDCEKTTPRVGHPARSGPGVTAPLSDMRYTSPPFY
jgi:hypothetical protein